MKIQKYTYMGQACRHDILFIQDDTFCRFGTDDESPEKVQKAYQDLCNFAADIADIDGFHIKRIEFSEPDHNEHRCKIEGLAFTKLGEEMKITLPAIEWVEASGVNEITQENFHEFRPKGKVEQPVINSILTMLAALESFASSGAGQLKFEFEEMNIAR
jgi:hypothetical protein